MAVDDDVVIGGINVALHFSCEDISVGHGAREIDGVGEGTRGDADGRIVVELCRLRLEGDVQHAAGGVAPVGRGDFEELRILPPGVFQEGNADVLGECGARDGDGLGARFP